MARRLDCRFDEQGNVFLNEENVGRELRTETIGAVASQIAARPEVRDALLQRQRDFARPPGLVADGRDMGTVVFPEAPAKIFLDASAEVRADRRYKQLIENGFDASFTASLKRSANGMSGTAIGRWRPFGLQTIR